MAYNHGREDRKWRIWKEAEEKLLRECGVDEVTIEQIRIADRADFNSKRYIWSGNSVRSILRSPIYAGNLVGYKRIAANMKSKKRPSKLPEEWEVIPNTHEGIVTQEEFDIVQQLITSRTSEVPATVSSDLVKGFSSPKVHCSMQYEKSIKTGWRSFSA